MAARDANRRFESLIAQADEPWRMLAVCVIGQALDDISPRDGPRRVTPEAHAEACDALTWVEGAPAPLPARLACKVADVSLDALRDEADFRAYLRWPSLDGTLAA